MSTVIGDFWEKYGGVLLLIMAIMLICAVAFKTGQLQKETENSAKINIFLVDKKETTVLDQRALAIDEALQRKGLENKIETAVVEKSSEIQNCAFVASKNSKVYHLPSCKNATKIKDSNKLCFASHEEAEAEGYQKAKCCQK